MCTELLSTEKEKTMLVVDYFIAMLSRLQHDFPSLDNVGYNQVFSALYITHVIHDNHYHISRV